MARRASNSFRAQESFVFEISQLIASGGILPNLHDCHGLVLRVWRGSKFHTTEQEATLGGDGRALWSCALRVPCTLFQSKTGKVFSAKVFNVSLLARHGKRLKEVARGEVDLSTFVRDSSPPTASQPSTLQLAARAERRGGAPVHLQWHVQPVASEEAVDDGASDSYSRAESASTLASGTLLTTLSRATLDQDLRGFERALEPPKPSAVANAPRPADATTSDAEQCCSGRSEPAGEGVRAELRTVVEEAAEEEHRSITPAGLRAPPMPQDAAAELAAEEPRAAPAHCGGAAGVVLALSDVDAAALSGATIPASAASVTAILSAHNKAGWLLKRAVRTPPRSREYTGGVERPKSNRRGACRKTKGPC
jgi:hypothetical protein